VPISHTLGWPKRLNGSAQRLDFSKLSNLTFEAVDACRFPAINAAYDCLKEGQAACIAFNAANEVAVAAFLDGAIAFTDIVAIVRKVTQEQKAVCRFENLGDILEFDAKMRDAARHCILNYNPMTRKVS